MAGPGGKRHRGGERGANLLEYATVFALVAALAGGLILAAPGLGGTISEGISRMVCTAFGAFGGQDCDSAGPTEDIAAPQDSAADSQPVADFFEGGFASLAESAGNAVCMAGACGGEEFEETWDHTAHAYVGPTDEVRQCPDWAAAEDVRSYRPDGRPSRPDGSFREDQTVGTFNMAGSAKNDAEDGRATDDDTVVDAIVRSVEDREPTFLALQEVCSNQAYALASELDDYEVHFEPIQKMKADGTLEFQQCSGNGALYGNAVLYRSDFADDIFPIPYQGGGGTQGGAGYDLGTPDLTDEDGEPRGHEKRGMACVASTQKNVVFCSAHLTSDDGAATEAETQRINEILEEEYPGYTALVGGDFNSKPSDESMGNMYDEEYGNGASGNLKEVDSVDEGTVFGADYCRGGESTHGDNYWVYSTRKKIDYIFVSKDVEIHDADATHSDDSDHDPLWSDVTF